LADAIGVQVKGLNAAMVVAFMHGSGMVAADVDAIMWAAAACIDADDRPWDD